VIEDDPARWCELASVLPSTMEGWYSKHYTDQDFRTPEGQTARPREHLIQARRVRGTVSGSVTRHRRGLAPPSRPRVGSGRGHVCPGGCRNLNDELRVIATKSQSNFSRGWKPRSLSGVFV
jgi:hypothetical protein